MKAQLVDLQTVLSASFLALNRSYDQKSLLVFEEEMGKIKKQILPKLRQIEQGTSDKKSTKEEQEVNTTVRALRRNIQFLLPLVQYKAPPAAGSAISQKLTGTKKVLVCMMRWKDKPYFLKEDVEFVTPKINSYVDTVSNNQLHFDFQYVENTAIWGDVPEERMPETFTDEGLIAIELCSGPDVIWSDIDSVVIFPSFLATWGVALSPRDIFVDLNGDPIRSSFSLISGRSLTQQLLPEGTFIHELLHHGSGVDIGPRHANYLNCIDDTMSFENCENKEYGNRFDVMGTGQISGHLGGWYQNFLGWIGHREIAHDETVSLGALEVPTKKSRLLRIPFAQNPICIEFRRTIAYDNFDQRFDELTPANVAELVDWPNRKLAYFYILKRIGDGISLNGCLFTNICDFDASGRPTSVLIDSTPGSVWPETMKDSCISEGTVFQNPNLGMSISWTPDTKDDTGNTAWVTIDIDESRGLK